MGLRSWFFGWCTMRVFMIGVGVASQALLIGSSAMFATALDEFLPLSDLLVAPTRGHPEVALAVTAMVQMIVAFCMCLLTWSYLAYQLLVVQPVIGITAPRFPTNDAVHAAKTRAGAKRAVSARKKD